MKIEAILFLARLIFWIGLGIGLVYYLWKKIIDVVPRKYLTWLSGVSTLTFICYEFSLIEDSIPAFFTSTALGIFSSIFFYAIFGVLVWFFLTQVIPAKDLTYFGIFSFNSVGVFLYIYLVSNILDLSKLNLFIGRSSWEWLTDIVLPILIPLSLLVAGYFIKKFEEKENKEKAKEQILQFYFEQIFEIQSRSAGRIASEVDKKIVRAKTLSVLQRLRDDGERKRDLIRFLFESDAFNELKISLEGADLSFANLQDLNLSAMNLKDCNLEWCSFQRAKLVRTNFENCNLEYVDFKDANLTKSVLVNSKLLFAQFGDLPSFLNTKKTLLAGADLRGAKDVDDIQLKLTKGWKNAIYDPELSKKLGLPLS